MHVSFKMHLLLILWKCNCHKSSTSPLQLPWVSAGKFGPSLSELEVPERMYSTRTSWGKNGEPSTELRSEKKFKGVDSLTTALVCTQLSFHTGNWTFYSETGITSMFCKESISMQLSHKALPTLQFCQLVSTDQERLPSSACFISWEGTFSII